MQERGFSDRSEEYLGREEALFQLHDQLNDQLHDQLHHDQLKLSYVPFQLGELVCPSREIGEFQVVDVEPQQEGNPRARPARLRQNIRPPNRYGYD